jgi:hypothetical protein
MIDDTQRLQQFFKIFHKDLTSYEIHLLQTGKGKWNINTATQKHIERIQKYSWFFRLIPGIKAVFFCNTTAFRSADDSSDIDLFIVCQNESLWTTRMLLTFCLHILGVRRHGKKVAGRFCLSFFATEQGAYNLKDLEIVPGNDVYLAFWTATLECVIAEKGFLERFQKHNDWIQKYNVHFTQQTTPLLPLFHSLYFINIIEKIVKKIFMPQTKKKAAALKDVQGTIISDSYLKFHNNDIRWDIAKILTSLDKGFFL